MCILNNYQKVHTGGGGHMCVFDPLIIYVIWDHIMDLGSGILP